MEEEGGRGRGGHKRWRRVDEGVVGEKGQKGSAGLSNVAFVYQGDSEATLVLLKVMAVLPSETLGSLDEASEQSKAEGRGMGERGGGLVL